MLSIQLATGEKGKGRKQKKTTESVPDVVYYSAGQVDIYPDHFCQLVNSSPKPRSSLFSPSH
jgi:hypothetical protein